MTGLDITDQDGWVITDDKMATSKIPGILCHWGCPPGRPSPNYNSRGDGATAGIEAYNYVTALGDK